MPGSRMMRACLLAVATSAALPAAGCERKPERAQRSLGPYMGRMQRYAMKLGYAIEAKNQKLARFYLEEIEELAAEIQKRVPFHDGHAIADGIESILLPALPPLGKRLEAADWPGASREYGALIDHCNSCHVKYERPFLVILPASGPPPYNQRFEP
jgi:hypothetical protein